MGMTVEKRLSGSQEFSATSGAQTGTTATAAMAAVVGSKNYLRGVLISVYGTVTAARGTITWTYGGTAYTIGIGVGVAGIFYIPFEQNPIEGDTDTAITVSVPSLTAATCEVAIVGTVWPE